MEIHSQFEASNRRQCSEFTIDVFRPVPRRGNDMSLFWDSNINHRIEEIGEYDRYLVIQTYHRGNRLHCASYGPDSGFNSQMKSVLISIGNIDTGTRETNHFYLSYFVE